MFTKKLILAAALVTGFAGSTVALADAETNTILKNAYQQGSILADCTNPGYCNVTFPATTDAKTVITAVTCIFALPPGSSIGYAEFGTQGGLNFFVQPFFYGFSNLTGFNTYGINAQVNYFFNKGDVPVVAVSSSGGAVAGLECMASGYHS
jgi:hypothetical protein